MATRHYGDFEWDEAKARANRLKHDVPFEEALTAFADPLAIDAPDQYKAGRFVLIGHSARGRVLFVVYEERRSSIRLISARKASPIQRRKYEEGLDAS
ncbi:MAG: BrnT family toxin [Nitrospirae bacterium]|nr:BrnT family toxin [Nitrospirota bacterium]